MDTTIARVGKLHISGPAGRKRWRVKYWFDDDDTPEVKWLGKAEGKDRITQREAERLLQRWLVEVGANPDKARKVVIPTLQEHIDHYLSMIRPRYRASTLGAIDQTIRYLVAHFGPNRRLDRITPTDVDNWFHSLSTGKFADHVERYEGKKNHCSRSGLSDGSLKPHINNARHIYSAAMKRFPGTLRTNPFAHIRIKVQPKRGTWKYVPYADAVAAIDACTDVKTSRVGWQVFIALQRFTGLRKGEALAVLKTDVDLEQDPPLIKVYASKTARATGMPSRVVPVLFPILEKLLVKAIAETPVRDPCVVSIQLPRGGGSDHRTLTRILERAGLERWRPGFQVLRACFEKDLLDMGLPEADYTKAVGHSPEVSRRFYLAKFEGASLDTDSARRFKEVARKLAELLPA